MSGVFMMIGVEVIEFGCMVFGIEFGLICIKFCLIVDDLMVGLFVVFVVGVYEWENVFVDGVWIYFFDEVWSGVQVVYVDFVVDVLWCWGVVLMSFVVVGVLVMMYGYFVFDEQGELFVFFCIWCNISIGVVVVEFLQFFGVNILLCWLIVYLYQVVLDVEVYVFQVCFVMILVGYVYWCFIGLWVLGIGDVLGMFFIDFVVQEYDCDFFVCYDCVVEGLFLL